MKKLIAIFVLLAFCPALAQAECAPGEEAVAGFPGVCKKRRTDGNLQFKVPAGSNVGFRATRGAGQVYVYSGVANAPITVSANNTSSASTNSDSEVSVRLALEGSARPERAFGALRFSVEFARKIEVGIIGGYGGTGVSTWKASEGQNGEEFQAEKKSVWVVGGILMFTVYDGEKFAIQVGAVGDAALLPGGNGTSHYIGGGLGVIFPFAKNFFATLRGSAGAEKVSWQPDARLAGEGTAGVGIHF
jgi:hypothetical protein